MRMTYKDGEGISIVQKIEPSLNVQFQQDQGNMKQQFRPLPSQQSFERTQPFQHPENKPHPQQTIQDPRSQIIKPQENIPLKIQQDGPHNPPYYVENSQPQPYADNRPAQNYSVDPKLRQVYPVDNRLPQTLQQDNRPPQSYPDNRVPSINYEFDNRLQQNHPSDRFPENWPPQQSNLTDNRQQSFNVDNRQHSAADNRSFQSNYAPDNAAIQNQYYNNARQPPYLPDNRISQQQHFTDNRQPQSSHADNRAPPSYQTDNRHPPSIYPPNKMPPQGYPNDNRLPQGHQDFRQPQQGFHNENRPPPVYQNDNRPAQQMYSSDHRLPQVPGYPERLQRYPNENRPLQQGPYPPDNRQHQEFCVDNRQTTQGYPAENRQMPSVFPADRPAQGYFGDGKSHQQAFVDSQLPHRYPTDNQKGYPLPETRRLNQQPQQHPSQESLQRQSVNQGYQQEQRPEYRELGNQDRRSQDFQQSDFYDPNSRGTRRPTERQNSVHADQPNRKRFPLRKYNSEERYGSFQQEYERQRSNSQTYDSPGEELDSRGRSPQSRYERSRQRSSSLDSHERNEQHNSKSRTTTFVDCSREDEEYENQNQQNRRTAEPRRAQRMPPDKNAHSKQTQRSPLSHSRSLQTDRVRKSAPWIDDGSGDEERTRPSERRLPDHVHHKKEFESDHRTRTTSEVKRRENFCPQHKKFVSNVAGPVRPTRRMLPKEPVQPMSRKSAKRQVI